MTEQEKWEEEVKQSWAEVYPTINSHMRNLYPAWRDKYNNFREGYLAACRKR